MAVVRDMKVPGMGQAVIFACKAWGLRLQRMMRDAIDRQRPRRHGLSPMLVEAPVLAEFESRLWPREDGDATFAAGKVQNLRVALRALHGLEVPAGAAFSFWKQVGRASPGRGYAVGRELREGCLIPSVGGGLCQLSNALYDCAVRAGLTVLERHRHSQVLPGSLAEHDRDATVFWNYVDLRLRAEFAWRLEVTMDAERLRVRIRALAHRDVAVPVAPAARRESADIEDCHACGQTECHRHVGPQDTGLRSAWWLSPAWPEFVAHARLHRRADDSVHGIDHALPQRQGWRRWREAARWRIARWQGQPLPGVMLAQAEREARSWARRLQPRDTRLVVPQSLLPFLWRDGVLAGRRFEVMMTALPMSMLQQQLDAAATRHPQCRSLGDFRAPEWLLAAEHEALAAAAAWISPHAQVCAAAGARARVLPWKMPVPFERVRERTGPFRVFLAASPLARKGVFELLAALQEEAMEVLLPPGDGEPALATGRASLRRVASYREGLTLADAAVLPAWVEHQPRALLSAMAMGLPVVATPACGLTAELPWHRVEAGDVEELRTTLLSLRTR